MESAGRAVGARGARNGRSRARASPSYAGLATTAATASSPRAICARRARCATGTARRHRSLKGDAAAMAQRWGTTDRPADACGNRSARRLVIDALFGAGLARPMSGVAAEVIAALNASAVPVLAVDVPSGLDGTTGAGARSGDRSRAHRHVLSAQARAPAHARARACAGRSPWPTSEFHRRRARRHRRAERGPTRRACGAHTFPGRSLDGHKYSADTPWWCRGRRRTRARRAWARAGRCASAPGWSPSPAPPDAVAVNAAHLTAIMLLPFDGAGRARAHPRRQAQERGAARSGAGRRRADTATRARRARIRRGDGARRGRASPRSRTDAR